MREIRLTKSVGMILLGIWLIVYGLFPLLKLYFNGYTVMMEILAIAAGVLILIGM